MTKKYVRTLVFIRWIRDETTSFHGDPDVVTAIDEETAKARIDEAVEQARKEGLERLKNDQVPFGCCSFEIVIEDVYFRTVQVATAIENAS